MAEEQIKEFIGGVFDELDKDQSGFLEKEEIHAILKKFHANNGAGKPFNEEMFEAVWGKLDNNNDGKITKERLQEAAFNFATNQGWLEE